VPKMRDHGGAGHRRGLRPEDAAAQRHGLETGRPELRLLPVRPAALGPDQEQDRGRRSCRAPGPGRHDVLERPAAVLAQEEAEVRARRAQQVRERPGRVDLRQQAGLALLGRLPGDPPPALELATGSLLGGLEGSGARDRDEAGATKLGRLFQNGLELPRLHQALGQDDPRPRRGGIRLRSQDGDLGAVLPDLFDPGQGAPAAAVEEPDLVPGPDPGRAGQMAVLLALEDEAARVLGDPGDEELVGGHASRRLTAGCS